MAISSNRKFESEGKKYALSSPGELQGYLQEDILRRFVTPLDKREESRLANRCQDI